MRKIASLMMQGPAAAPLARRAPAPSRHQRPSLSQALHDIRRRHIAAHLALLDLIIPSRLHA